MKRNTLTLVVGGLLLLIFMVLLFTFQVRETEVAVVTTFGKPTRPISEPGLKWKWPRPIQKVTKFDKRIYNFEGRFEQTLTKDNYPLLVMLYVGWTISDPQGFFNSFPGGQTKDVEPALSGLIESGKNEVIGKHPFSHFVSINENELKFAEVEQEVLKAIQPVAKSKYGIDIKFVGIKKMGLPESVTEKVFNRMQAERQREVDRIKAEGESRAMDIKSAADRDRDRMLATAGAKAMAIRGEADKEATKAYATMDQNPELAVFLLKLRALEETLKDKSTLIFDERTIPYDLFVPQSSAAQPTPSQSGTPRLGANPK
ncbi:MAG: protease modulator HflC [Verrucomicrobia bacterium]|nr:protease modulator HflC [Verrucomicrobiota bacterium]